MQSARGNGQRTGLRLSRYARIVDDPSDFATALAVTLREPHLPVLRIPVSLAQGLRTGPCVGLPPELAEPLRARGILTEDRRDELDEIVRGNADVTARSTTLQRIVMPTAECPHGCNVPRYGGYCGQLHEKRKLSSARITDELLAVDRALASRVYTEVSLGVFGGEPLVEFDLVLQLVRSTRDICTRTAVSLRVDLTTSGLLFSHQRALALFECGLTHFEVTLDGTADTHDLRRCTKAGHPTFAKTYANLLAIGHDQTLRSLIGTIRVNVDRRNANAVSRLFDALVSDDLIPRYNFYISPTRNLGHMDAATQYLDRGRIAELDLQLLARAAQLGLDVDPLPARTHILCPAVNPHAVVLDPFGDAHRCTETPLVRLKTPLPAGFQRDQDWRPAWEKMLSSGEVPCPSCVLFPVCGGACPKDWLQGNVPCPIYKENLDQRIVLAAFRRVEDLDAFTNA